jgi:hypothetical protein
MKQSEKGGGKNWHAAPSVILPEWIFGFLKIALNVRSLNQAGIKKNLRL